MKNTEKLEILGRSGLKYTDEYGVEYHLNSEMIVNEQYDIVVFSDDIHFYSDYLKKYQDDNLNYTETYDKNKKYYIGLLEFKNEYNSNISKGKIEHIIKRIIVLGENRKMKIKAE